MLQGMRLCKRLLGCKLGPQSHPGGTPKRPITLLPARPGTHSPAPSDPPPLLAPLFPKENPGWKTRSSLRHFLLPHLRAQAVSTCLPFLGNVTPVHPLSAVTLIPGPHPLWAPSRFCPRMLNLFFLALRALQTPVSSAPALHPFLPAERT